MLIQKTNGNLCRITKQQLKSSINTNTEYNNGTNITIDSSNNINLDTTLEDVNSLESETNTDLKLESNGSGDILLKANPSLSGTGKIHLSRGDSDSVRFNTIEYRNYPGSAYIKFLVHNGSDNTSQTELLKLNGDGVAEFNKTVYIQNGDTAGYGSLEIGGASGGLIDLKKPFSDDYDLRIMQDDTSKIISKSSLVLFSNDTTAITIDTSQNSTFVGNISIASGKTYKINGTDLSGANLNYSAGSIQLMRKLILNKIF